AGCGSGSGGAGTDAASGFDPGGSAGTGSAGAGGTFAGLPGTGTGSGGGPGTPTGAGGSLGLPGGNLDPAMVGLWPLQSVGFFPPGSVVSDTRTAAQFTDALRGDQIALGADGRFT